MQNKRFTMVYHNFISSEARNKVLKEVLISSEARNKVLKEVLISSEARNKVLIFYEYLNLYAKEIHKKQAFNGLNLAAVRPEQFGPELIAERFIEGVEPV